MHFGRWLGARRTERYNREYLFLVYCSGRAGGRSGGRSGHRFREVCSNAYAASFTDVVERVEFAIVHAPAHCKSLCKVVALYKYNKLAGRTFQLFRCSLLSDLYEPCATILSAFGLQTQSHHRTHAKHCTTKRMLLLYTRDDGLHSAFALCLLCCTAHACPRSNALSFIFHNSALACVVRIAMCAVRWTCVHVSTCACARNRRVLPIIFTDVEFMYRAYAFWPHVVHVDVHASTRRVGEREREKKVALA